jgi:catechol 2,3-dioxygenase-like lactoylglutathione lyase family enzyme
MAWKLDQLGIVVDDLDKALEFYSRVFGPGLFEKMEFKDLDVEVRGEPAKLSVTVALARVGDIQVELIQAEPGENIYWEFVEKHGEGLHHLAFAVPDVGAEVAKAKEKGIPVLMYGKIDAGDFAYLDAKEPGSVITEIYQRD